MKTNLNVWIHCRINPHSPNALLNYQYDELSKFAKQQDMQIVGATKIISDGKFMDNISYRSMITCIRRNRVDAILMYSPLRISIYPDLYEEFKLFCKLNKVSVICLCDFE